MTGPHRMGRPAQGLAACVSRVGWADVCCQTVYPWVWVWPQRTSWITATRWQIWCRLGNPLHLLHCAYPELLRFRSFGVRGGRAGQAIGWWSTALTANLRPSGVRRMATDAEVAPLRLIWGTRPPVSQTRNRNHLGWPSFSGAASQFSFGRSLGRSGFGYAKSEFS